MRGPAQASFRSLSHPQRFAQHVGDRGAGEFFPQGLLGAAEIAFTGFLDRLLELSDRADQRGHVTGRAPSEPAGAMAGHNWQIDERRGGHGSCRETLTHPGHKARRAQWNNSYVYLDTPALAAFPVAGQEVEVAIGHAGTVCGITDTLCRWVPADLARCALIAC